MAVARAAAARSGTLGIMYYKFSGFTQNLVGAWASHAYSPQVRAAPRRLGGRNGRLSLCAGPSRRRSRAWLLPLVWVHSPHLTPGASPHLLAAALEAPRSADAPLAELARPGVGPGTLAGVKVTPDSLLVTRGVSVSWGRRNPECETCRTRSWALSFGRCPVGVSCRSLIQARDGGGGLRAPGESVGPGEAV